MHDSFSRVQSIAARMSFLADRTLVKVELLAWVVVRLFLTDVLWLNGAHVANDH